MICGTPKPIYPNPYFIGLKKAKPLADGYSVYLQWAQALPSQVSHEIGYNVYFSTNKDTVLSEGPKYFTRYSELTIKRFNPGDVIYFLERAMEYDPIAQNPLNFVSSPQAVNAFIYPETALASNIDAYVTTIPLVDIAEFPTYGVLKVGYELIRYANVDYGNNIIYATVDGRGYYNTTASEHTIDGYDGYQYLDPTVRYYEGWDDQNYIYSQAQPRFEIPEFPFTETDGYRTRDKDILTTDLSASDDYMEDFPGYDYSGYHRTSMVDYFSGKCLGSYHGGEIGCADDDGTGNGGRTRPGVNLSDRSAQRLEMKLEVDGEPVVLLRRKWTGITCRCVRLNQEHHEGRCPYCFQTGFVGGYDQFYSTRDSSGRIQMRFSATIDNLAAKSIGLQQDFVPNTWSLPIPAIKDRDVLIRFNQDGTEEFRYEVVNVTRNKLMFSLSGAQAMTIYRLDKTDPIYQWRSIRDTSMYPGKINTSMDTLRGHGPHTHTIVINENITTLTQINSTTSTVMGHNHAIINGVIQDMGMGHTHEILLY